MKQIDNKSREIPTKIFLSGKKKENELTEKKNIKYYITI